MLFQEALARLPHGDSFRFIDRLTELVPGKSGAGEYLLRGDEPFLEGHFPGQPAMPGVLLIEGAAQLAGMVAQSDPEHPPLPGLRLTAVRSAKLAGTAAPGETIAFRATITGRLQNLVQAEAVALLGGREILKTQIVLSGQASV